MQITRDDDFGGAVLNCAVRYALGRASYMPSLVMGEIRPMLPDCSDKTLWCFDRDIGEWLADCGYTSGSHFGGAPYRIEWSRFREDVVKEIERRKREEQP